MLVRNNKPKKLLLRDKSKFLITTITIDVSTYSDESIKKLKDCINIIAISENWNISDISFRITDSHGNEVL